MMSEPEEIYEDEDIEMEDEDTTTPKVHVAKKVYIEIRNQRDDGSECMYGDDVDEEGNVSPGGPYTSVGFFSNTYGGSGGCKRDDPEEINSSVEHYKAWIIKEGDIPIVKDYRQEKKLSDWFGG